MKKKVFKYSFDVKDGIQFHNIPSDSRILKVDHQGISIVMWVEVMVMLDEHFKVISPFTKRGFTVYGTGHTIDTLATYVGTALIDEYVWHLYER